MPSNNFLSRLFKKDKEKARNGGNTAPGNNKSQVSNNNQSNPPPSSASNSNSNSNSNSSNEHNSLEIPRAVNMASSASSASTIHPVDSHSHVPHLRLARFMEKKEHHFFSSFDNNNHQNQNSTHLKHSSPQASKTSLKGLTKPVESKFDDYNALVTLVSKYGIVPDNTVDLMKLLNAPDDSKPTVPEAKNPETALIIGKGAGGSVYPLYDSTHNHLYAMKKLRLQLTKENWTSYEAKLKNEFRIANKLRHQNLIRTYDLLQDNDLFIIVMDYAPFDFFTIVMAGVLTKHEIYCYFKQMCNGVSHMHSIGLAHRDLKLDNCVVDKNGILKLVDFGSSVIFDMKRYKNEGESKEIEKASGIMGSDPYLAPEVITFPFYDPSLADVWSLAIIYCCMILRRFPWRIPKDSDASFTYFSSEPGEIIDKNGHKKIVGPDRLLKLLPSSSQHLLGNMLKINPNERYSMVDINKDEFFMKIQHCHYINYDADRNRGDLVKGKNHTHHLITNRQFTEEHPDDVKKEKEREEAQAKEILAQNNV